MVADTNKVTAWKSKRLFGESIKPLSINYVDNVKITAKFDESCLKQEKVVSLHKQLFMTFMS